MSSQNPSQTYTYALLHSVSTFTFPSQLKTCVYSASDSEPVMSYPDQSYSTTFTSASSSPTASSNVMENVSFFWLNIFEKKAGKRGRNVQENSWIYKQDHKGEDVESGAAQVYGIIAGAEEDAADSATGILLGSDEVFDLSAPSIFDTTPEDVAEKPLYDMFVKAVGMQLIGTNSVPAGSRWGGNCLLSLAGCSWRIRTAKYAMGIQEQWWISSIYMENPHKNRDLGIVDSGCSRSMTGNKEKLDDFVKIVGGRRVGEFQLPEISQVVLRIPRRHNLYCFSLSDIQPERDVTCLLAKASLEESTKWHRRMAHVNFKNMNKLAKHGLVKGLPSKLFTNEHNCIACNKGKQHKASYKAITAVSTISAPLQLLHMDLFGPTSIRSIDHKYYSLVVTDDFNRYDNGTEFKNFQLIELCGSKEIRRDYSNARTPQQNGVAKRKNRTLIEAARTMLADSKLHTMFWDRSRVMSDAKVNEASNMVESSSDYAEELARLQKQAYEANAIAEKHLSQADFATSRNRVPAGRVDSAAGVLMVPSDHIFSCLSPVHTAAHPSLHFSGHSLGSSGTFFKIIEAHAEEMQQFVNQDVCAACPSTRWKKLLLRNNDSEGTKEMSEGILSGNKARLVAQECFPVWEIEEESLVNSTKGFEDLISIKHVCESVKALYGFIKHPGTLVYVTKKAWCDEFKVLMKGEFEMSVMGELTFFLGLQVKQKPDGIFISQDKYVQDMLKKFDMESVRTAIIPYEASKPKSKDEPDDVVNVYLYRSMIGSLMYLIASRPDIMFAVSACSRHQVTPLTSHLNAVKKIFKYLKGQPKLGLWYPRDSPFVLEAYSDSDYAGSHGDRKSTTGGCQFLGRRLISWQCKKQTIMATSSTEAEYVAAANCCGQCGLLLMIKNSFWYALTHDPIIFDSLVKQFWSTASLRAPELGPPAILATIDRTPYTITEDTIRSQLSVTMMRGNCGYAYTDIFLCMDNLEVMSGSWDQFGTPLDYALICLCEGKKYNWSRYIFTGMPAIAADTYSVPADATQATEFPPSSSIHTDVPTGTASDFSVDPSNKGKSIMVEEDPPIKERSFRQMEEAVERRRQLRQTLRRGTS
ncbi:putative ribonuclease H-like domain-containing protein [Tanacetum coccineum]